MDWTVVIFLTINVIYGSTFNINNQTTDQQPIFIRPSYPGIDLKYGELLCNCSTPGCGIGRYKGICKTGGGCMKTIYREAGRKSINTIYDCIAESQYIPRDRPLTCYVHKELRHINNIGCCHNQSFCNSKLHQLQLGDPPKPVTSTSTPFKEPTIPLWQIVLLVGVPVFVILFIVFGYLCIRCNVHSGGSGKWMKLIPDILQKSALDPYINDSPLLPDDVAVTRNLYEQVANFELTTGSGSGLPVFVQRTIARQIELKNSKPIGTGRFGEVWLGSWKGDFVAVKIFHSFEEKSWFREVEIFQTTMLHHPNILRFVASDNKDAGISTQLWLITQYHQNGSLFDYLYDHTVPPEILCRMLRSIANGLAFLHLEVPGTSCRPAIAHRDLKSKNILVQDDLSCSIADLGMAVRYSNGTLDKPMGSRVGTRRYLPPELLDCTMNEDQFESYRRADIYSLGLVIWEIANRTTVDGVCTRKYDLPYFDKVPPDPTLEDMKSCVCDQKLRPDIHNPWMNHKLLNGISKLMRECWAPNPAARLPALRVKKSVDILASTSFEDVKA